MIKKQNILWLMLVMITIIIGVMLFVILPKVEKGNIKISQKQNSNTNDTINKTSQENITYEIKNIKPITKENYYSSPTFSPDGNKIAFTNLNLKGIYIENIADGTKMKITDDEGAGFRFSWSPDSKAITYLSRKNINGEAINSIKVVEIETGKTFELTTPGIGASMPSFTQSNEVIYSFKGALIKRKLNNGIIGEEEIIAENVPANIIIPSPKNDILVVENDEGIVIMNNVGENRKMIVKNGEKEFAFNASFSFDQKKVLYFNNVAATGHMYVYDIRSEGITDLGIGFFGQWLPDNKIVYCITQGNDFEITDSELYVINSDGTQKVAITNTPEIIEMQPCVSFDGKLIAFKNEKDGRIFLFEINELK